MTSAEYQDRFDTYVGQNGLRLVDVSGYGVDGEARYAAIWADVEGPKWVAHHGLTPSQYETKFDDYTDDGFRATLISGYSVDGSPRFAGVWEQYDGPRWALYYGMTASGYQRRFDDMLDRGFRPTDVTGYSVNGDARYAAIWQQFDGPEWAAHHGMSGSGYQDQFSGYLADGLRLTDVGGFGVGGTARYVATWQEFPGPEWAARHGLTGAEYQQTFDDFLDRGFRLTDVSGYTVGGEPRFAAIWRREHGRQIGFGGIDDAVETYMRDHEVPGLSLAVTKDERLVFAKGYGYANREAGERMRPEHRLRIASISKPITGVAILRLMEDGELALSDEVFGSGGILGTTYGTPTHGYGNGGATTNITVHHLLQHSAGWTNNGGDPMFMNPGMNHDQLISWVLSNRPLQYRPGTSNKYLNFGYCLLGRVVEAVSGTDYEQYVRDAVLRPAGVTDMAIAGNTRSERRTDEAAYYGANPYGMKVARMDAHGGWIATPTDLLRLTVRVDGFPAKTDILGSAALNELSDVEGNRSAYGEGWMLRSGWRGHNGAFDGSVGYLVRRDDGISFAVITNTRPSGDRSAGTLRSNLDSLLSTVGNWPSWDLF